MIPGDEWKFAKGTAATVEDCRKWAQCKTRLLAATKHGIHEIRISKITPGGIARVSYGGAVGIFHWEWLFPEELMILEILPDVETQIPTIVHV